MKELIALVATSPGLQIVTGAFILSIIGLITALVAVIVKRGIKIGKIINIPGIVKEKKNPSIELALLPSNAKDESRTIVQEGVAAFCEHLMKIAGDYICGKEQAGCRHTQAEHEYQLIVESLQPNLVGQIMQSVERNHYAELTDEEWIKIRNELFNRIFFGAEAYIEKRFESTEIQITAIRKSLEDQVTDFQNIFNAMAERIRGVSQRRLKREQEIGQTEANS